MARQFKKNHHLLYIILNSVLLLVSLNAGCTDDSNHHDNLANQDSGGKIDNVGQTPDVGVIDSQPTKVDTKSDQAGSSPITWTACDTSIWPTSEGYSYPPAGVECATIKIPLDYAKPQGATFSLRIARHKSKIFPKSKPLFYLAGGPGGSAVWSSSVIPMLMPRLLETYDLIYVDQRGTGASDYLACSTTDPKTGKQYPSRKEAVIACGNAHAQKDLNHYLSVDAAHDVDWVRHLLGYEKMYLLGVSYGTRLALEIIRQHESNVAAIVIDGMVPPNWDMVGYFVEATSKGIARLVEDCSKDPACTSADVSPNLAQDLETRRLALKAKPRKILINGNTATEEDDFIFSYFLENMIERSTWRYRIPRAVHQAILGKNDLWNKLIKDATGLTVTDDPAGASSSSNPLPSLFAPLRQSAKNRYKPQSWMPRRSRLLGQSLEYVADGSFLLINCAEFLPNVSGGIDGLNALAEKQTWFGMYSYDELLMAEGCSAWKAGPLAQELRQPVSSKVKALLTSGDIDVNTPRAQGEEVAKGLPNSTHVVLPYTTHPSIMTPCSAKIIESFFMADGDMKAVDTSCIQQMSKPTW